MGKGEVDAALIHEVLSRPVDQAPFRDHDLGVLGGVMAEGR